jgi:hypothetical protein
MILAWMRSRMAGPVFGYMRQVGTKGRRQRRQDGDARFSLTGEHLTHVRGTHTGGSRQTPDRNACIEPVSIQIVQHRPQDASRPTSVRRPRVPSRARFTGLHPTEYITRPCTGTRVGRTCC